MDVYAISMQLFAYMLISIYFRICYFHKHAISWTFNALLEILGGKALHRAK
jgi:hypothetical protein